VFVRHRSIVLNKDVVAGEELFCDYGYLDNYVQLEATLKTLFNLGKWITNKDDSEFLGEIKKYIQFIKSRCLHSEGLWINYIHFFKLSVF
jgi:hypothetical protein